MLHDLKNKFILMLFFYKFFFCPLNKIVVAAYSVFIDLPDNSTFNIYFQLLFSDIWFFINKLPSRQYHFFPRQFWAWYVSDSIVYNQVLIEIRSFQYVP